MARERMRASSLLVAVTLLCCASAGYAQTISLDCEVESDVGARRARRHLHQHRPQTDPSLSCHLFEWRQRRTADLEWMVRPHCERSETIQKVRQRLDCFVAIAPRNDERRVLCEGGIAAPEVAKSATPIGVKADKNAKKTTMRRMS